jgi:hypothetical protein
MRRPFSLRRYLRLVLLRKLVPFSRDRGLDPNDLEPVVNRVNSADELQAAIIFPEGFLNGKLRGDDPAAERLRKNNIMATIAKRF